MSIKKFHWLAIGVALLALNGCSSSQTSDSQTDDVPDTASGTDAAPAASVDAPPSPGPDDQPPAPSADAAASNQNVQAPPAPVDAPPPAPVASDAAATPPPSTNSVAAEIAPTPTMINDPSTSAPTSDSTYKVRRGDTLMKIAFENYGDLYKWKDIYVANQDKIKNPNLILPGTELRISKSETTVAKHGKRYRIKTGETLATISTEVYGSPKKWKKIWTNNKDLIKDPNRIFAGFFIYYTFSSKDRADLAAERENAPASAATGQPSAMNGAPTGDNRAPASVGSAAMAASRNRVAPTLRSSMMQPSAPTGQPASIARKGP